MIGGMGQRRPPTGPSPFTAGKPNPMAGFQGGASPVGPQWGAGGPNPGVAQVQPGRFGGPAQGVGPQYGGASPVGPQGNFPTQQVFGGGAQPMAPWMRPPPPQMPPGGGAGVQVAQGQPPPGGWGSGGAPGYYPPDPNVQAMPLLQAPMGIGGGPQDMSDAMMHPFAPRNQIAQMQGAMGGGFNPSDIGSEGGPSGARWAQMQGAMGGGPNMRQRRFPGALGRGIMQAMAPPPQAAPPAPYGGQQFRMW